MKPENDLIIPGLVHDLNNVFQTLVDAADRLSDEPRWAPVAASILRSVERGKSITASLEGRAASAPLETILTNAWTFVHDSALKNADRVRMLSSVEPGIEMRRAWAWERVMTNLFFNSVRAMREYGTISVDARRCDGKIEIAVRDDGAGIPSALMERVFEPGVSGNGSNGLGLHIVRTIVQQDGGEVRAANLERGTEFVITLPASACAPALARTAGVAAD